MLHRRCSSSACQSACLGAPMLIIVTYVAAPRESSVSRDFGNMAGTWPEHGRNMAGTWLEHGWNMAGTWRRRRRDVIRYTNGKELPPRRDGAPESERRRSAMSRRRVWNALSSVFATIRAGGERVESADQRIGSCACNPRLFSSVHRTRGRRLRSLGRTLSTPSLPARRSRIKSPRKPWEKRSAKSSAETQALCGRTWGQRKEAQGEQSICRPWRWTTS
jgi:hypothetical protein